MTPRQAQIGLVAESGEETRAIAAALGHLLDGGEVLALLGELGSGKTTFAKGLAAGLDVDRDVPVSSPTYVIEHIYPGRLVLHHYDVYRLSSAAEFEDTGFAENIRPGHVLAIEWAGKVRDALPPNTLEVELLTAGGDDRPPDPDHRTIRLRGPEACWADKLERLAVAFPRREGRRKAGSPTDRSS